MQCHRCKGLMIPESFLDIMDDTGRFRFHGWRCLICGDVSDPIIQAHRKHHISPMVSRTRKTIVGVH